MRDLQTYFRKPVSFSEYYFIIVKLHGFWCFDCGTWDFEESKTLEREAQKLYGKSNVKLNTSPTDDSDINNRIIKAMNRG